jgi:hypothetical protein
MLENIPKRLDADAWSLETTTMYEPGEESIAEASHLYALAILAGRVDRSAAAVRPPPGVRVTRPRRSRGLARRSPRRPATRSRGPTSRRSRSSISTSREADKEEPAGASG